MKHASNAMKMNLATSALLFSAALLVIRCRQEAGSHSPNNASPGNAVSDRGNTFDNFLHTEMTPGEVFNLISQGAMVVIF